MLPFTHYHYHMGENLLEFVDSETDLGVNIDSDLNFNLQCESLLSKANQQYGLVKRTCQFVNDIKRRRVLYLTLVRSYFEHCSPVWRSGGESMMKKFEKFQKKCIKWILFEEELSYSVPSTYIRKCRQANILPLALRFKVNDLVLMFKIIHGFIPVTLPTYLTWFNGTSRLRKTHMDRLSLVCSLIPSTSSSRPLEKPFFYRTHSLWNSLPIEIREITALSMFRSKLEKHLWESAMHNGDDDTPQIS